MSSLIIHSSMLSCGRLMIGAGMSLVCVGVSLLCCVHPISCGMMIDIGMSCICIAVPCCVLCICMLSIMACSGMLSIMACSGMLSVMVGGGMTCLCIAGYSFCCEHSVFWGGGEFSTWTIVLVSSPSISVVWLSAATGFLFARETSGVRENQFLNIMKELPHDAGSLLTKHLEILECAHIFLVTFVHGVRVLKEASIIIWVLLSTSLRYCVSWILLCLHSTVQSPTSNVPWDQRDVEEEKLLLKQLRVQWNLILQVQSLTYSLRCLFLYLYCYYCSSCFVSLYTILWFPIIVSWVRVMRISNK